MEAYLGFSRTQINNYWDFIESNSFQPEYAEYTKTVYNSIFLGTDAVVYLKPLEFALSLRCSFYKYGSFQFFEKHPYNYYPVSTVDNLRGANTEAVLSIGFKYKKLKLSVQGGGSIPIISPYALQTDIFYSNIGSESVTHKEKLQNGSFISRISLQYNFGKQKKK